MKTIAELTDENFDQAIATAPVPVVVDFCAPWCGPCKTLAFTDSKPAEARS